MKGFTRCCHSETLRAAVSESNKIGFTLIELLVVVLIIGILSAVALPQYQKAILKSRMAGLLPVLKSIAAAEEEYYLANGSYTDNLNNLSVNLPGIIGSSNVGSVTWGKRNSCSLIHIHLGWVFCKVHLDDTDYGPNCGYRLHLHHANQPDKLYCTYDGNTGNSSCQSVCNSINS